MNIIDKNSFKKFLKELVPVVFLKTSLVNVIAGILSPGNFINRFLQSNYITAHSSLKLNYI